MLLSKNVEIILNGANFKHFYSLGYENLKSGNKLIVPVEHLSKNSKIIVSVKCDICGNTKNISYYSYCRNIKNDNYYTCEKCSFVKSKKTRLNKYGNENYCNKDKIKETKLHKYGNENYCNKDKIKKTFIEKYGVCNIMQNEYIFNKQQISSCLLRYHDKMNLYYRGTYEQDFLDFCFENNINIKSGKRVFYLKNDEGHYYFSDFYYEPLNLIIEIKSKYTYERDLILNKLKKKYCVKQGYKHIFIIDKDYNIFGKYLSIN